MVATEEVWLPCLHHPIVEGEATSKDPSVGAFDIFEGHTSILKTLVHDLQELSLLWIHVGGFEIVDAEEAILELAKVFVDKVSADLQLASLN